VQKPLFVAYSLLDLENGSTDGAPPLENNAAYRSLARVFSTNYADFKHRLEDGRKTLLDPFAATNPAEFIAVATETSLRETETAPPEAPRSLR